MNDKSNQQFTRAIFITGASSGLGAALAEYYAQEGVLLGILARRKDKLLHLSKLLRAKGAQVEIYVADVTNDKAMQKSITGFMKKAGKVDIVIANSGVATGGIKMQVYPNEEMRHVIDVNVSGVINTINGFLPFVLQQQQGKLVAVSSVAAFRSLPGGTYSASKIAVKYIMDVLRLSWESKSIRFITLYPGFVDTEMTRKNAFAMPFIISDKKAAEQMAKAIEKNKSDYIFPFIWRPVVVILKLAPSFILRILMKKRLKADQ